MQNISDYTEILNDLLRFNENKGTMNISEVADYLKEEPDKVSSEILKGYKYLDGKAHRFPVVIVAHAICDHLICRPISAVDNLPVQKIN